MITNPHSIIKTNSQNRDELERVTVSNNLINKIEKLEESMQSTPLPKKDIQKLARKLIKEDSTLNPKVLEQFDIDESALLTGVACLKCKKLAMERLSGSWFCPSCLTRSKQAHIAA